MINILLLALLCILGMEIFLRSNLLVHIKAVASTSRRAVSVITSNRISDHWKEKILPKYSLKILKSSGIMLTVFISIIIIFLLAFYFKAGFYEFTLSLPGIIEAVVVSIVYIKIR